MTIRDKAVLITGASRGLGRALAEHVAALGGRVVLVARDRTALDRAVTEIRATGGLAHALHADVADKSAVYPLAAAAAELVGPLDAVVHNASDLGPTPLRLLLDTECEDLERVLAVNLVGPFRLTRAIAGSMALRQNGVVAFISSDAAVSAYARWGAYSVSKAAADHMARIWAEELSAFGVRVLSIDPGEMDTVMHAAALPEADPATLANPRDVAARIARMLFDPRIASGSRILASQWQASP